LEGGTANGAGGGSRAASLRRQSLGCGHRGERRDGQQCIVEGALPPACRALAYGAHASSRITDQAEVRDGHQLLADIDAQGELVFALKQKNDGGA